VAATLLAACLLLGACAGGGSSAASPVSPTAATPFALSAGWWDSAVCYEVFVRSFFDSNGDGNGDLNGLIQKLDYINDGNPATQKDLGTNCIWLMPVAESPSYHGYDVVDYYKVEQDYGSNDDFKRLVQEAHKRGIKVLIDLVLNHTSSEHPWFQEALRNPASPYRSYYIWSKTNPGYSGPWGESVWHISPAATEYYYGIFWEGMPDLDYRNPAVTAEARKISSFWRNDMGVDGFRLDAIKHVIEDGQVQENTPETHAWLRDYRTYLAQSLPGTFTVGEIFGADPSILTPYYPDQLDTYFTFEIGYQIIDAAGSGQAGAFLSAVESSFAQLPSQRWAPFLTNHDQDRLMTTLGDDLGKARIAATALLTLPGLPFVYYGEELGMTGQKPDERLRTPMQWTAAEHNGGFTADEPWETMQADYREVNVAAEDADPTSLLNLYRQLIQLHTSHPALAQGDFTALKASDGAVAAYLRQAGDETVLVVLNFSPQAVGGATIGLEQSALAAGSYTLEPLLGDQPGAPLTVTGGGGISGYAPLSTLAPQTGYVFRLAR
jgi:glycosidase